MKPTEKWREAMRHKLIHDEGITLKPYRCPAGKWTIGVGRNIEDNGISETTVRQMLDEDIDVAINAACNIFTEEYFASIHPLRQQAIINMLFNLGETRFRKFEHTIALIKMGDWKAAKLAATKSLWYTQVKGRGERVVALFELKDAYPS